MSLLPDRHPNLDFFVLDIADAVPKDDMASMEHPLFSLATKPDMRHLEYRNGDNVLKIRPSGLGLPTIFDKDILIFTISQLMARKNRGEPIGDTVRFSARELSVATNRPIGGNHYKRLEDAFARLQGAQFVTNIKSGGKIETRIFSLIDEGGFVRTDDERFRLDYCEVKLSRWLMRAIETDQVVTITHDYFRLRRPLERRLYEIARKHCGFRPGKPVKFGLDTIQKKCGSQSTSKEFKRLLKTIVEQDELHDHFPDYTIRLDDAGEMVTFTPRADKTALPQSTLFPMISENALQKARAIAPGYDVYALKSDYLAFWDDKGRQELKNPDAAFLGWCKKRNERQPLR